MLKKLIGFFGAAAFALVLVTSVDAAVLKNAYLQMSDSRSGESSVTHTFRFYAPGAELNSVQFEYCALASGACTTPVMTTTSAAESTFTRAAVDVSGDWGPVVNGVNGTIQSAVPDDDGTGQANFVMAFSGITNPDFTSACTEASGGASTETCYVRITTYSDTNYTTAADSAVVSLTITRGVTVSATVDPSFSLVIAGVNPGATATANSTTLTTGITPSVTTLPFGNLSPATPKYIAHSATVTTNATNGYSITVRMGANMAGSAYGDDIDPFTAGGSASNVQAASWTSPTGTTSGTDTGWLGVGTNDTDVTGHVANAFFSLRADNPTTVATQTTSASALTNIFVYGIEVNAYQEADSYSGTMRYNALPVY